MAAPLSFELVHEYGNPDATLLAGVVDTSPSLSAWSSVRPIAEDFRFVLTTLGVAYDAAVYSALRPTNPERPADLPVGAALGDAATRRFFAGYARDKETGDPDAHAEIVTLRHARELGVDPRGLTLGVTLEPCPACLSEVEEAGVARVVYGSSRSEVEQIGLIKPHILKAADIVKAGRIASSHRYPFEFFQFPNRAVQSACLELFAAYGRDPVTEIVTIDRSRLSAKRFRSYNRQMAEQPMAPILEEELILRCFTQILDGFYRNASEFTG